MPSKFYVANKAVVIQKQKILLLEDRDAHFWGKPSWDLPGGRMESNESMQEALIRELQEELPTATNVQVIRHLHTCRGAVTFRDGTPVVYSFFHVSARFPTLALSSEHTGFYWAAPSELKKSETIAGRYLEPDFRKAALLALV